MRLASTADEFWPAHSSIGVPNAAKFYSMDTTISLAFLPYYKYNTRFTYIRDIIYLVLLFCLGLNFLSEAGRVLHKFLFSKKVIRAGSSDTIKFHLWAIKQRIHENHSTKHIHVAANKRGTTHR